MCRNYEVVKAARELCIDIEGKVCKPCRFRRNCSYLAQRHIKARFWIVAHSLLFFSAPQPLKNVGILIVDENIDGAAFWGIDDKVCIAIDLLADGGMPFPENLPEKENYFYDVIAMDDTVEQQRREFVVTGVGEIRTFRIFRVRAWIFAQTVGSRLQRLRRHLLEFARAARPGAISRQALLDFGFCVSDANFGARYERLRIYYGEDKAKLANNGTFLPMLRIWEAIAEILLPDGPEVSGRLFIDENHKTKARSLRVTGYQKIHPDFQKPTLLLDALFNEERTKYLFPQIVGHHLRRVDAPFMRICKTTSLPGDKPVSFAKYMFVLHKAKDGEKLTARQEQENITRAANCQALRCFIINAARHCLTTLVISNKDVIEELKLPEWIETGHFNNIAGIDKWKDVELTIIIGGACPSPGEIETMVGAITGSGDMRRAPSPAFGKRWHPLEPATQLVRQGDHFVTFPGVEFRHPDPLGDLHLDRIFRGQVAQGAGRPRPLSRNAEKTGVTLIVSDQAYPEPVDQLFDGSAVFATTPEDRMFAEGGIAFESGTDAARAYPQLWPSADAAKKALQRAKPQGDIPLIEILLLKKCPPVVWRYQLKGERQKIKQCQIDMRMVPDPRATLSRFLGVLTLCETVQPAEVMAEPKLDADPKDNAAFVDSQLTALADLMGSDQRRVEEWIGVGRLRDAPAEAAE